MKRNVYRINYKNGNSIECKAYSLKLEDGKLYKCGQSLWCSNPEYAVINGEHIASVDIIEKNNNL